MSLGFLIAIRIIAFSFILYVSYFIVTRVIFKQSRIEKIEAKLKEQRELIKKLKELEIPDPKELKKAEKKLQKLTDELS
jgi:uncharacterized coiled-coil protein SlyX